MRQRLVQIGLLALLVASAAKPAAALAADLQLDASYGKDGLASLGVDDALTGASYGYVPIPPAMVVLEDGRVLFGGRANTGAMRILRLGPDGRLDAGFGRGGRVDLPFDTSANGATPGIAVTRDGRIVVAGGLASGGVRVLRLGPDGSLDSSFGVDGFADRRMTGSAGPSRAVRVALDSQERILVAASCDPLAGDAPQDCAPRAWRLLASGADDPRFAGGALPSAQLRSSYPLAIAVLPDDSTYVLLEEPFDILDNEERLVRLLPDGQRDTAFTAAGLTRQIRAIAAFDGALYVAQQSETNVGPGPGIVTRLVGSGLVDPTFGDRGSVSMVDSPALGAGMADIVALADGGNGTLLGSGMTIDAIGWSPATLFVRVNRLGAGGVDRDFGQRGLARLALGMAAFNGQALRRDAVGRVVVAGLSSSRVATGVPIAARLLAPGSETGDSPGVLGFEDQGAAIEERGSALITVMRIGGVRGRVSVDYETVAGTATEDVDYRATRGHLEWADGDGSSRQIVVPILVDSEVEQSEWFRVELRNAVGAPVFSTAGFLVSITASDSSPASSVSTPAVASSGGSGGGGRLGAEWLAVLAGWVSVRRRRRATTG